MLQTLFTSILLCSDNTYLFLWINCIKNLVCWDFCIILYWHRYFILSMFIDLCYWWQTLTLRTATTTWQTFFCFVPFFKKWLLLVQRWIVSWTNLHEGRVTSLKNEWKHGNPAWRAEQLLQVPNQFFFPFSWLLEGKLLCLCWPEKAGTYFVAIFRSDTSDKMFLIFFYIIMNFIVK